ncbi:19615_t:CDS:2, partial [Gigaspora rosea]
MGGHIFPQMEIEIAHHCRHGGVIDWAVESLRLEVIKEMSSKMITCFPVDNFNKQLSFTLFELKPDSNSL